ncbi:MAG: hypothetical protein WBA46_17995, partial [Thermomicrobiales bacterium]
LMDAGLRIVAQAGMRGLTHRAVDREAGVPAGTTSNYARTRAELVGALGTRSFERLAPPSLEPDPERPPSLETAIWYVQQIAHRVLAEPDLMIALFELRLEARRHPDLRATLQETLARGYATDVLFNQRAGLPGGAWEIALLHFAIDGLMLDQLTVSIGPGMESVDATVADLVRRILAPASASTPS